MISFLEEIRVSVAQERKTIFLMERSLVKGPSIWGYFCHSPIVQSWTLCLIVPRVLPSSLIYRMRDLDR